MLLIGDTKLDGRVCYKCIVKGKKLLSTGIVITFQSILIVRGQNIFPKRFHVHVIEDKPTEQPVLSIGYQGCNLFGRAGQNRGQAGGVNFHEFMVGAPVIGDGFMVKSLAKPIGVIAVIRFKSLCKGVSFGFKDQSFALVVRKQLKDPRC